MTSPSSLLLSLQHAEQLDPTIRLELEQIIQAFQTWAGKIQAADGNILLAGMGSFLGQPQCRLAKRGAQSIPNATYSMVVWDAVHTGAPLEEYDDHQMFDGTLYVVCKEPGTYVAVAEMQWAPNAVGARLMGIHPNISYGVNYFNYIRSDGNAGGVGAHQLVTSVFRVIKDHPLGPLYVPCPLLVGVQVHQTSGGALNIGGLGDTFGVWKVS